METGKADGITYQELILETLGHQEAPETLHHALDVFVRVGTCQCLPERVKEALLVARAVMARLESGTELPQTAGRPRPG